MPDTSSLRTKINESYTTNGQGSITGSIGRTVLLMICDLIDGIFTTFLKVGTNNTATSNADDVYHVGKIIVGRTSDDGGGQQLQVVGGAKFAADNPVSGSVVVISNTHSTSGRTGAKILFDQNGVAIWSAGMAGDTDAFVINGYGGATFPERLRINASGQVGIGTSAPTANLHIKTVSGASPLDQFRIENSYTPASTNEASGSIGNIIWDTNFIYIRTSAGWKRSALSTF